MLSINLYVGGFPGLSGDKLAAVPWELFSMRSGEQPSDVDRFFVDIDKQMLLDAPSFERSTWPDLGNTHIGPTGFDRPHYAQKPYWNSDDNLKPATIKADAVD